MKQSPDIQSIQRNMSPGSLSAKGFIGDDTRNISDIIAEDDEIVKRLTLTHEEISERMHYFSQEGKKGLGSPVTVDDRYEVIVEEFMGFISCPFRDRFRALKKNTTLTDNITGKSLSWTDLNIHLICRHGFYEGKGAFFRIDPLKASQILGLRK